MNKKQAKHVQTVIVRRNNVAYREAKIKTNVLHVDSDTLLTLLSECKTQAQLIDVALANKMSLNDTATALVTFNLCKTDSDAVKRIKRHERNDKQSRIVKRAVALTVNHKTINQEATTA